MPGAVEIWTGPGCDWQGAIANIAVDPSAATAPRATSVLPFPMLGGGEMEHLIDCRAKGVVDWEFLSFRPKHLAPLKGAPLAGEWEMVQTSLTQAPTAVRRLAPALMRLMHSRYARAPGKLHRLDRGSILFGHTQFRFGPDLAASAADLSRHVAVAECTRIPYVTARGPNGAWLVRRGPAHPLTKFFDAVSLWHVPSPEGVVLMKNNPGQWNEELSLHLFATQLGAMKLATARTLPAAPARISGAKLVEALGACDEVQLVAGAQRVAYAHHHLYLRRPGGDVASGWQFLEALVAVQPQAQRPALLALLGEVRDLNARKDVRYHDVDEDEDEDEDDAAPAVRARSEQSPPV
jgi:hypothetical protein